MVIVGFAGVHALDLVGPFDVFTGATASLAANGHAGDGYEVGEAPGSYVERVRTEAARRQLEETDDMVTAIAARCGFGTAETMRRNFIRHIGVSPDQYRKTFA